MTVLLKRLRLVFPVLCLLLFGFSASLSFTREAAAAEPVDSSQTCGGAGRYFLGIPSWDRGIGDCEDIEGEEILSGEKTQVIAANIAAIATHIAVLVAVGFVIYGGFLFALSGGNAEQATNARKTIINAAIGLVITIMARIIAEIVYNSLTG